MADPITVQEIACERFISVSGTALSISGRQPALRRTIDRFLHDNGIEIKPSYEVDNLGGVMSLIASTGGVALLPHYAETFLPPAVTTRSLQGPGPKIDVSLGYRKGNSSSILKLFLSRVDALSLESPIQAVDSCSQNDSYRIDSDWREQAKSLVEARSRLASLDS